MRIDMACGTILIVIAIIGRIDSSYGRELPYPVTLVLSLNGFRWDVVRDKNLTNIQRLIKDGVHATHGMKSSYTTEELPNLITLVTGLHAENHGIVGNYMHDPLLRKNFKPSTMDEAWYKDFEPIWITNEKLQKSMLGNTRSKRKSAVVNWPASNIAYNRSYPWYYNKILSRRTPAKKKFDEIINLLDLDKPPNLILCHFQQIRHRSALNYTVVHSVTEEFDQTLGYFINKLQTRGLFDLINIVMVSDHGSGKLRPNGIIRIPHVLKSKWYHYITFGGSTGVWPKRGFKSIIYKHLKALKHVKVFLKSHIPERLHFKHNRRIPPIIAIADKGWVLTKHKKRLHSLAHGYDNANTDMNALFIARGPAFKRGYEINTFHNIHIYELLCHVLNITARPNNGSLKAVEGVLAPKKTKTGYDVTPQQALAVFLIPSAGIILFLGCLLLFEKKRAKLEYIEADSVMYAPVGDNEADNESENRQANDRGLSSVILYPWLTL